MSFCKIVIEYQKVQKTKTEIITKFFFIFGNAEEKFLGN